MAKKPEHPKKPKDPAKPTRAKAARPDMPVLDNSLADLLDPAIGPGAAGLRAQAGLQQPPDNSWDRRADFANALARVPRWRAISASRRSKVTPARHR